MDEATEFLYKYVMNNYPMIHENDIQEFKALNRYDLEIVFKNGDIEVYDTFNNTVRKVLDQTYSKEEIERQLRRDFKRRLLILMTRAGVDQTELAARMETTQQMISRYLTGESIPNAITLNIMAKALKCTPNDFYEDFV